MGAGPLQVRKSRDFPQPGLFSKNPLMNLERGVEVGFVLGKAGCEESTRQSSSEVVLQEITVLLPIHRPVAEVCPGQFQCQR